MISERLHSKQALKAWIAAENKGSLRHLPLRQELLELIGWSRLQGYKIALVTGSSQLLADEIAGRLRIFDLVKGSTPELNLTGPRKAQYISSSFPSKFAYWGNSVSDAYTWELASLALVATSDPRVLKAAQKSSLTIHLPTNPTGLNQKIAEIRFIFSRYSPKRQ